MHLTTGFDQRVFAGESKAWTSLKSPICKEEKNGSAGEDAIMSFEIGETFIELIASWSAVRARNLSPISESLESFHQIVIKMQTIHHSISVSSVSYFFAHVYSKRERSWILLSYS
jgi:hypothetical protein